MASSTEDIKYYVNEEEVEKEFEKPEGRGGIELSVAEILESAGFSPADEWTLTRNSDNHEFGSLEDEVPLSNGERFTAKFKGPTPTSR